MASWAGVRLCSFSPEGAGFPCAGPGEEINDRGGQEGRVFRANVGINQELVPSDG